MFPENLYLIPDGSIGIRDVYHTRIHADVAYNRNPLPFDEDITDTVA